ncbi:hypothetical protein DDZ13_03720 [Coraliomargarita sinensis]|uniref:Uncharacterized protein n=1 Tax=Coraliomargarita sinensis TaxID=2174842 RepID=A0A317ZLH8_9BACT|nr:hypothetical protein [Coraliomargarita sinensis]PXA05083.1 hypothetical protein DDZ13_03720 [Coraliomargarita sinensis]
MKLETDNASWNYNFKAKTVRLGRRYQFDTPVDSESFAEKAGTVISFPNLSVFVDPIFGKPEASVTIECHDNTLSLSVANQLFESFDDLHSQMVKTTDVA